MLRESNVAWHRWNTLWLTMHMPSCKITSPYTLIRYWLVVLTTIVCGQSCLSNISIEGCRLECRVIPRLVIWPLGFTKWSFLELRSVWSEASVTPLFWHFCIFLVFCTIYVQGAWNTKWRIVHFVMCLRSLKQSLTCCWHIIINSKNIL